MATPTKERKVVRMVLERYKNMPFLWQQDHEDYMNREVRQKGFQELLQIYQEFDEECTMKMIRKKIENLRTHFLKEWKKVQASQQAEDGKVYVPCLWYYGILDSFIHDRAPSESSGRVNKKPKIYKSPKRRLRWEYMKGTSDSKKLFTNKYLKPKKDEPWEAYGKYLGFELKDVEEPQLVICKKIISDAIFYAKMNKLNENSQILNPESEAADFQAVEYLESE